MTPGAPYLSKMGSIGGGAGLAENITDTVGGLTPSPNTALNLEDREIKYLPPGFLCS